MKKKLLYYEKYVNNELRLNITTKIKTARLIFKDIETGETVTSTPLLFPTETSNSLFIEKHYSESISKIINEYDVLWDLTNNEIKPIPYSFEEIQLEYRKLLNTKIKNNEINTIILNLFKNKKKTK